MNARNFEATETLRSGRTVRIRSVRPADKAGVQQAFAGLDPESVYTRFFQHKQTLSDRELNAATEVDFENVVALVVTTESGGREVIIGGGRYAMVAPPSLPRRAEVAFLVEEEYHGQGIAGRILNHLVRIAREKGVSQFEAEVLPRNKAMLSVFARCGLPMKQSPTDGAIQVALSLAERPESASL